MKKVKSSLWIIICAAFSFSTESSCYEAPVLFIALNRRTQRTIPPSFAAKQCECFKLAKRNTKIPVEHDIKGL